MSLNPNNKLLLYCKIIKHKKDTLIEIKCSSIINIISFELYIYLNMYQTDK